MNKKEYNSRPKLCKKCKSVIVWEKKCNDFCNRSCSASYNNAGVRRHKGDLPKCLYCDTKLNRLSKKYCNNQCQNDYEWKIRKEEISKLGVVDGFPRLRKRFILELRGHKCDVCKGVEWMGGPIPLILDHINGNSEDNRIDNLRLVCGNCDMQLPTYKSKNRGNGRHSRRERYKEGKSY